MKIFASGRYNMLHRDVTEDNMRTVLADDFRARMLNDVELFLYYQDSVPLGHHENLEYIGNFYCDKEEGASASVKDVNDVTKRNLERIEACDHLIVFFHKEHAMASVVELMYAASLRKPTTIFYNPEIAGMELTKEYWFAMITAKEMNPNVELIPSVSEESVEELLTKLNSMS